MRKMPMNKGQNYQLHASQYVIILLWMASGVPLGAETTLPQNGMLDRTQLATFDVLASQQVNNNASTEGQDMQLAPTETEDGRIGFLGLRYWDICQWVCYVFCSTTYWFSACWNFGPKLRMLPSLGLTNDFLRRNKIASQQVNNNASIEGQNRQLVHTEPEDGRIGMLGLLYWDICQWVCYVFWSTSYCFNACWNFGPKLRTFPSLGLTNDSLRRNKIL